MIRIASAWEGVITRVGSALMRRASHRSPDFVVGGAKAPYLLRWWLIPRNRFFNVYLHAFWRDDDDRALHDHPWPWCSILLDGEYIEHTIAAGGIHRRELRKAGSVKLSGPRRAHRIELLPSDPTTPNMFDRLPCWSLFITGPKVRNWGFHCPERGFVPWQQFVSASDEGSVGPGCDGP